MWQWLHEFLIVAQQITGNHSWAYFKYIGEYILWLDYSEVESLSLLYTSDANDGNVSFGAGISCSFMHSKGFT